MSIFPTNFTEKLFELFIFGLILLSGVAFSMVIIAARIFYPERISDLIYFQSYSVFISFLIQAGLRAELRNQIYKGRHRLVRMIERYISTNLSAYAMLISLILLTQDILYVCFAFSYLFAYFTLIMGIGIAVGDKNRAAKYSVATFLLIVAGGGGVILCSGNSIEHGYRYLVEVISIMVIFALSAIKKNGWEADKRAKKSLFKVIFSGANIQVSAFFIYFLGFLLSQYVLMLSKYNSGVALIYADMLVFCGAQLLLVSRLILYAESFLLARGWVTYCSILILVWSLLAAAGAYYFYWWFGRSEMMAFLPVIFVLAINSKPVAAVLVQFAREKYKRIANVIFFVASSLLAYNVWVVKAYVYWPSIVFSPFLIALVLIILALLDRNNFYMKVRQVR